jgi:hypothetical protein
MAVIQKPYLNKNKVFPRKMFFFLISILVQIATPVHAKTPPRFEINSITIYEDGQAYQTISSFDLSLSELVNTAINHGVPINIVLQYAQPQKLLWTTRYKTIAETDFELFRNGLTDSYVLKNRSTFKNLQYPTIEDALQDLGSLQLKNIPLESIKSDELAVRIHLDLFALPPQIRARAFFSGRWRHDSDWLHQPLPNQNPKTQQ